MKIAITHPTNWPAVRRGAERFMNELAAFLAARGHEVTIISAHRARRTVDRTHGYTSRLERSLWHPVLERAGIKQAHPFYGTTLVRLVRDGYDVVHACGFTDALAAITLRRLGGPACLFWINGSVHGRVRANGAFARAVRGADEVVVLSRYVSDATQERFGRRPMVVPVPVDTDRFRPSTKPRHSPPILLCASVLDVPRKGGTVLFQAFDLLKRRNPNVRLHISSSVSAETEHRLLSEVSVEHRGSVRFLGAGVTDELPALYARASVTVLPSVREAFGMVIPESMASGTPVVGARHGAIPELVRDDRVGVLFDPGPSPETEPTNFEGLAAALAKGLALARLPETTASCRSRAQELGWDRIGPVFEEVYERIRRR